MKSEYDVVVVGGSVSGLVTARESASRGARTVVLEEDLEVGQPEKCAGMVSIRGLMEVGIPLRSRMVRASVEKAFVHSPSGLVFEIDARRQGVIVLDRSELDVVLAHQACKKGAVLEVGRRVTSVREENGIVRVGLEDGEIASRFVVDASGVSSTVFKNRARVLPAALFEVYAPWVEDDSVHVYLDQIVTPGFFRWVIPAGDGCAKVGAAGRGINPGRVVKEFLDARGGAEILKKVSAPIVVGGLPRSFIRQRIAGVGDAVAQCKPTTGGGIYTGGVGGLFGGRWAAEAALDDNVSALNEYDHDWRVRLEREFQLMALARRFFEEVVNKDFDTLLKVVSERNLLEQISGTVDFDHHSLAFTKLLGVMGVLQMAGLILSNEMKRLLHSMSGREKGEGGPGT